MLAGTDSRCGCDADESETMTGTIHGTARQLTGPGRSAIAAIRVQGELTALDLPTSLFRSAGGRRVTEFSLDVLHFGVWGDPGEDVVVCRTGENTLEMTCHGGVAAVKRILEDLAGRGFVEGENAEQVVDGRAICGLDAQNPSITTTGLCLPFTVLREARTQRTAEILLMQASEVWDRFAERLERSRSEDSGTLIDEVFRWAEFGRHLIEPWNVVLCGRPNVGKSSLMNALAGYTRSIVSEQAGTTRDRITLETAIEGWPVRITDTAGIRETQDTIEREGVAHSFDAMDAADLVVLVLDQSQPLSPNDLHLLERTARRRIVVAHKADLPAAPQDRWPEKTLSVSSVNQSGIHELLKFIALTLVPCIPDDEQPVPVTLQQVEWLQQLRNLG